MFRLREETPDDEWEVEALLDSAFGPGRHGLSAYRLRDGVEPVPGMSLLVRDGFGSLSGCIRFWPILVGGTRALLLGPVAVHPTRQGEGLGGALIRGGIVRAKQLDWKVIFLVGDEPYYRRFGFSTARGVAFPPPTDPKRVLFLRLDGAAGQGAAGKIEKWTGK